MKKLSVLMALVVSMSAFGSESFKVLVRSEKKLKVFYKQVVLKDLKSKNSFDGKYFKIVKGKSKEAISFQDVDQVLLIKAATVYYHLTIARDFWIERIKSERILDIPKIIVRLEITNVYDEFGHFANDKRTPQYNNALSIPAGETPSWVPEDKQDKWDNEIWFRPVKKIHMSELPSLGPNPLTQALTTIKEPILSFGQDQFDVQVMQHLFYPQYVTRPLWQDAISLIGTYAMLKVAIVASRYLDPLFLETWYYLDSAMVPEIIAHEYAHIVLSDSLAMTHSTPVNEGMADYFAAVQSGKRKVYAKVTGHSTTHSKDTENNTPYSHWNESNRMATGDFTLSVLWDVRETLGDDIGDKIVYQARKYLETKSSTISDSLLRAILRACDEICENPRRDKLKLYQTFSKKGF